MVTDRQGIKQSDATIPSGIKEVIIFEGRLFFSLATVKSQLITASSLG